MNQDECTQLPSKIESYRQEIQEMRALARRLDRMERWIHEIAAQTGVKLSYE